MKIAITGVNGFLGSRIKRYYEDRYEIIPITHAMADFTQETQAQALIETLAPAFIIHCAAISDVGECERDKEGSYAVNVTIPTNLAKAAAKQGIPMLFCSSDQVYAGSGVMEPHKETEEVHPAPYYGQEKLLAEEAVMRANAQNACLRLSWMFDPRPQPKEFATQHATLLYSLRENLKKGNAVTYPDNDYRSITNVWSVIKNMELFFPVGDAILQRQAPLAGIFNCGSENAYSTYELMERYFAAIGADSSLLLRGHRDDAAGYRVLSMNMEKAKAAGMVFEDSLSGLQLLE